MVDGDATSQRAMLEPLDQRAFDGVLREVRERFIDLALRGQRIVSEPYRTVA